MAETSRHESTNRALGQDEAERLAESIRLFGSSSRLRILWALVEGPLSVEELSDRTDLSQSAASHQLRLLRQGRLVRVKREGRRAFYELHDHHLPEILSALRSHRDHVEDGSLALVPSATSEMNSSRESQSVNS